jgi:aarF domain-containing kinase
MYCVLSDSLSTKHIFTTELVEGIPVDKCVDMDVETRQHISRLVMGLCLKELFEFRYMQTDPNWSNFLYNPETRQVKMSINLGIKEFFVNRVAS